MEALDELAVKDVGLGTVDDAVDLLLVGCREDLLGGDVGQEEHAFFVLAAGTLPEGLVGNAHGQVRAVAALEVDAFEVERVHFLAQSGQAVQMCFPLVDGVAVRHAADVKNELPQLLDGGCLVQLREHLFGPGSTGHGGNGPLHPVVHGVLTPRSHIFAVGRIHPADLGPVQPGIDLRIIREEMQDADAALALRVVEIAAQLVRFEVAQGFLAAQLHPGAGNSVVAPIHLHVPGTGLIGAAHAQAGQRGGLQRAADDEGLARLGIHTHPDDKIGIFFQKFVKVFHERFLLRCKPCLFCFSIPVWGGNVHHPETKRRPARLKKGEASVIRISRMLSTYGMRSRLSGFASGIDAFLLLTPDANAKGGMLHDAFRNFGSAHTACNCGFWHVRHCVEDLQQQKMTASVRNLRSFFVE